MLKNKYNVLFSIMIVLDFSIFLSEGHIFLLEIILVECFIISGTSIIIEDLDIERIYFYIILCMIAVVIIFYLIGYRSNLLTLNRFIAIAIVTAVSFQLVIEYYDDK